MKKKTILFDVDGTLYDNANKGMRLSSVKALELLKSHSHEIVIATGRAYFMLYSIKEIEHLVDHYILINGQYIIAHNKVIYEDVMTIDEIESLITVLKELGIVYGFESSHNEAISELNENVKRTFEEMDLNLPPKDKDFYKLNKVYQMWCFCTPEQASVLESRFPNFAFVRWLTSGYDIIKKGQSKGKGLRKLSAHLDCDLEDFIAFGDGDNDIEMINEAGLGIAMGNATESLKKVADYITCDVSEDGIYKALKHFKLI